MKDHTSTRTPPRRLDACLTIKRACQQDDTTNDLFGFLTTEPNEVVAPIHPKAMEALKLQRLFDGLEIVASGMKKDE